MTEQHDITVRVPAAQYADEDDCLAAAARDAARERGLEGWDLQPRWEDEVERDTILLTVPGAACDRCGVVAERGEQPGEGRIVRCGGESALAPYAHGQLCDDCAEALLDAARAAGGRS